MKGKQTGLECIHIKTTNVAVYPYGNAKQERCRNHSSALQEGCGNYLIALQEGNQIYLIAKQEEYDEILINFAFTIAPDIFRFPYIR